MLMEDGKSTSGHGVAYIYRIMMWRKAEGGIVHLDNGVVILVWRKEQLSNGSGRRGKRDRSFAWDLQVMGRYHQSSG